MKIVMINYTGTVGKTTLAANLFAPRMPDAQIFAIETINETVESLGIDVEKIKGDRFMEYYTKIMLADNAIIDVGASNVEFFLSGMMKFKQSVADFDYFVIPVTSGVKEQRETVSVFGALLEADIPPEKIKILPNRVEQDVESEFAHLVRFAHSEPRFAFQREAAVFENELYDMLSSYQVTITDLLKDETDYRALARATARSEDQTQLKRYTDFHLMKMLALTVHENLEQVFRSVFREAAHV
ncbi:hypothetical protein QR66_11320 [Chromobacterium piscinae]|nr:hypothetical protein QR66_11320 [Chromobacterium piscinae]